MVLQRFGNEATKPLVSYGLGLNCSLSGSGVLLVYGKAFTKTNKTPYCGQNPSGFNKRYGVWSYESKLSTALSICKAVARCATRKIYTAIDIKNSRMLANC